jgi:hypothetical protein
MVGAIGGVAVARPVLASAAAGSPPDPAPGLGPLRREQAEPGVPIDSRGRGAGSGRGHRAYDAGRRIGHGSPGRGEAATRPDPAHGPPTGHERSPYSRGILGRPTTGIEPATCCLQILRRAVANIAIRPYLRDTSELLALASAPIFARIRCPGLTGCCAG